MDSDGNHVADEDWIAAVNACARPDPDEAHGDPSELLKALARIDAEPNPEVANG